MQKSITSANYRIFLDHLKRTRESANLSQQELAKSLGQTQSFISKCERGERRLDVSELLLFCQAMNITLTSFIENFEAAVKRSNK